jgi:hypothetical protein
VDIEANSTEVAVVMGKIMKRILQIPEWLRVLRYRWQQQYRRLQILVVALRQRLPLLIVLALAATLLFGLDKLLYPSLSRSFVKDLFSQLSITQEGLAAIVAGLSVILGLLVTIYVFAFQLSGERFNATDRMLSFFREERVGNIILDFLTFSIIFSLLTLLALGVRDFMPYISVFFSLILAIASVVLIVVYFRRAIELTQPGFVFRNIAGEAVEHLGHLSTGTEHGPSVEDYTRRRVAHLLDLFREFITVFIGESPPKDSREGRKEAAAEGMFALLSILQRYVEIRRLIPEKSYWFARRDSPMPKDGSYSRQRYSNWAQLEALGQLPETVIDESWFEKRLLDFTSRVFSQAVDAEMTLLLSSIPMACQGIVLTALKAHEFDILEMVAEQVVFPYLEQVSETRYPSAAQEIYNVIWVTWRTLLEDDGSKAFLDALPNQPWLDAAKIRKSPFPALFRHDVLALEEMLEYEVLIEGGRVSPDAELIRYCREHSIARLLDKRRAVFELLHSFLTTRIQKGIRDQDVLQVANAVRVQMTLVRQVFLRGPEAVYEAIADTTLKNASEALPQLTANQDHIRELLTPVISEAFHFLVNMIHLRRLDRFRPMLALYIPARLAAEPMDDEMTHANEELIVLGSLAFLYSEFDQMDKPFRILLEVYQQALNLDQYASLLEIYLRHWELTIPWITRYHEYFLPIMEEMHNLPERAHRSPGEIGFNILPDHPSPIIQRIASLAIRPPMETAAYYLYLRICETIGREPDDQAGRLHV